MTQLRAFFRAAYRYAKINFVFQFLSLYEDISDNTDISGLPAPMLALIEEKGFDGVSPEDILPIRTDNIRETSYISEAADLYAADEYMINRLEHRFKGVRELPDDYSDLRMTGEILSFLAGFRDEAQNLRLSELIAELPVRMTKQRFYDILRERLSIYKESDTQAFGDILEAVRSAAGLAGKEHKDRLPKELISLDEALRSLDPASISESGFSAMSETLSGLSSSLERGMSIRVLYEETLNSFLMARIASGYLSENDRFQEADSLIETVASFFRHPDRPEENRLDDDMLKRLDTLAETLENVGEELKILVSETEGLPSDDAVNADIAAVTALYSQNRFSDPYQRNRQTEAQEVSDKLFDDELCRLTACFADLFGSSVKTYNRAVMARVFSVLPPHFSSQEALETYIYDSLSGCQSVEEKLAFSDIFGEMKADETV